MLCNTSFETCFNVFLVYIFVTLGQYVVTTSHACKLYLYVLK